MGVVYKQEWIKYYIPSSILVMNNINDSETENISWVNCVVEGCYYNISEI